MGLNGGELAAEGQVRRLLDQVLQDRSDAYRATVLDLVVRYGWDVNDPNFLILIATGQMEVLLEQFPEQFETLFVGLLGRLQAQGGELKDWFAQEQTQLKELIRGLEMIQAESKATLESQMNQLSLERSLEQERTQQLSREILTFAQKEQQRVEQVLQAKMQVAQKEFLNATQSQAKEMVKQAGVYWKRQAMTELVWVSAFAVGLFFMIGMGLGVVLYNGIINRYTDTNWARQLWEWNKPEYRECKKLKRTTCNFHIVEPED